MAFRARKVFEMAPRSICTPPGWEDGWLQGYNPPNNCQHSFILLSDHVFNFSFYLVGTILCLQKVPVQHSLHFSHSYQVFTVNKLHSMHLKLRLFKFKQDFNQQGLVVLCWILTSVKFYCSLFSSQQEIHFNRTPRITVRQNFTTALQFLSWRPAQKCQLL